MLSVNLLKQAALYLLLNTASAVTIAEINGIAYLSPLNGQNVTNVTGVVTAKSSTGIFVRSLTPDNDPRSSESIFVFDRTQVNQRRVGEVINFGGRVTEYRSAPAYVYLTEIANPVSVRVTGNGTAPLPLVLGSTAALSPPTQEYNSLDNGNVFGIPNNVSQISRTNKPLEPSKYSMDFWESLVGELVTIPKPIAASKPNNFGDTWVYGAWPVTGKNSRGGLSQVGSDANGEAINIGTPLDGTRNPNGTLLGDSLADITGVVYQQFGFYYVLPTTAIKVQSVNRTGPLASRFTTCSACSDLTVGSYNVENLSPNSTSINGIAGHIAGPLRSPALLILQEIQDNNGPINDDVVDATVTLSTLTRLIRQRGGASYNFTDIPPVDDTNGGQPGGNIRSSYLYDSRYIKLFNPRPGNSTGATSVLRSILGPTLSANPGLIDPLNPAFNDSRRPIAAQWVTADGLNRFFTIDLHLSSKGGSTSLQGDPRPPVNLGVDRRGEQLAVVGRFVRYILDADRNAAVIVAGDFNEFEAVSIFADFKKISGLTNIDEAAGTPPVERYSYLFGQNSQQLDQFFVSDKIARRRPEIQHVHVNTWVSFADQISDHDPSVAKVNVCQF